VEAKVEAKAETKPAVAAVSVTKSAPSIVISKAMPSVSVSKTAAVSAPTTISKSVQVRVLQGGVYNWVHTQCELAAW
jgi:hypothetical protein